MGTKNEPGIFDCYANALPDEPMFVLLARDPEFARIVREWSIRRSEQIHSGLSPDSDWALVLEAQQCAADGAAWRKKNDGKWRGAREESIWDSRSNRSYEPVERRASEIYDGFSFDGFCKKPPWAPHGNSTMQDEARDQARRELRFAGHTPERAR